MSTNNNLLKVVTVRARILDALSAVQGASAGDSTHLPVLKSVLVKASQGAVTVICTNLDLAATVSFPCKILKEGAFAVPLALFLGIVKGISGERISLERTSAGLGIASDNYEATIQGQEAADFPIIPRVEGGPALKIALTQLRGVFERISPATQVSEIRPEISGVFMTLKDDRLVFVATDSFRLAEAAMRGESFASVSGSGKDNEAPALVVPLRAVHEFVRVFQGISDGDVMVSADANQIHFKDEPREFLARRVSGSFPDYEQIIPKSFASSATMRRVDALSAVRLVSSLSGKGNDIIVRTSGPKTIEIYASQSSLGDNVARVPARVDGDGFTVTLNWRYVSDGLRMCTGEDVVFGVNSPDKPVGVSSPSDPLFRYIVMPIKG